jgi:hypothetical protein
MAYPSISVRLPRVLRLSGGDKRGGETRASSRQSEDEIIPNT